MKLLHVFLVQDLIEVKYGDRLLSLKYELLDSHMEFEGK